MPSRALVLLLACAACDAPVRSSAQAKIVQVTRFGAPAAPTLTDVELLFECPAEVRRMVRLDARDSACAAAWREGEVLTVELVSKRADNREGYRSEVVAMGGCAVAPDLSDSANYELVQECSALEISGVSVGVTCDRRRSAALLAACPFVRR